jgi:hypothetical protein
MMEEFRRTQFLTLNIYDKAVPEMKGDKNA